MHGRNAAIEIKGVDATLLLHVQGEFMKIDGSIGNCHHNMAVLPYADPVTDGFAG